MSRFWAGFALSSVLWIAAAGAAYSLGFLQLEQASLPEAAVAPPVEPEVAEVETAPSGRRGRPRRGTSSTAPRRTTPEGEATTGDDLGELGMRTIEGDGAGGEQQLGAAQIDQAFDGAMGRIRRCLVLIEGDDPVRGRVTFGMRIGPDGSVRAVQLSGPAAATTGEAGSCLQAAARAIRFPSFDGPEMLVRYPLTLE